MHICPEGGALSHQVQQTSGVAFPWEIPLRCLNMVVTICFWCDRFVRHIHETCMCPSRPVNPSLWEVPSSEAKGVFLYSHISTKRRRYITDLHIVQYKYSQVQVHIPESALLFGQRMCRHAFNHAVKLTHSVLSCNRQQCVDAASPSLGSVRDV